MTETAEGDHIINNLKNVSSRPAQAPTDLDQPQGNLLGKSRMLRRASALQPLPSHPHRCPHPQEPKLITATLAPGLAGREHEAARAWSTILMARKKADTGTKFQNGSTSHFCDRQGGQRTQLDSKGIPEFACWARGLGRWRDSGMNMVS